ncbi:MAG: carboxypeptidase-like regulatory domain-containing protein [Candidatus Competibacteraceae bacterium]|jgi:hypothetical protein|nr:carboxypeptidase-like regulatory domain-containing protein [Candidatus Competibacteraceae bacterium]
MLNKFTAKKLWLLAIISGLPFITAQAAELVAKKYNEVAYVSGGIGDQEQAALKAMADEFNLNLVFAVEEGGNYLSDVAVRVYDAQGALALDVISDGPMLYANLPAGQYNVEVSGFGEIYQQNIEVSESGRESVNFTWPRKKAIM